MVDSNGTSISNGGHGSISKLLNARESNSLISIHKRCSMLIFLNGSKVVSESFEDKVVADEKLTNKILENKIKFCYDSHTLYK